MMTIAVIITVSGAVFYAVICAVVIIVFDAVNGAGLFLQLLL